MRDAWQKKKQKKIYKTKHSVQVILEILDQKGICEAARVGTTCRIKNKPHTGTLRNIAACCITKHYYWKDCLLTGCHRPQVQLKYCIQVFEWHYHIVHQNCTLGVIYVIHCVDCWYQHVVYMQRNLQWDDYSSKNPVVPHGNSPLPAAEMQLIWCFININVFIQKMLPGRHVYLTGLLMGFCMFG